ncbi:hypothetical protein [uncultured Cohaesibacter sp.]|uniref:hypothetical protein n=1 Tax=uncultured Cohaesibacter sp. TaxID=1002546 RepID=UPI0029C612F1|nr:hypothetical protein [uncultured Cohaesibacter sp.]
MTSSTKQLIKQLHFFNDIDQKMQVSTILAFLEVADAYDNGRDISVKEVQKRVGFHSSSATRNIYYWAEGHDQMSQALGFVDVALDQEDRRRRVLGLTVKGRKALRTLKGIDDGEETGEPVAS